MCAVCFDRVLSVPTTVRTSLGGTGHLIMHTRKGIATEGVTAADTLPPHSSPQPPCSMVLSRLLVTSPYNGSITVRTPAPCDHPSAFVRYRLPRAPETCTPFTRGCMTSEPHPTRFERAPGAFSDFTWCSGLGGRTVWRVMMAHLAFGLAKRSVRAVWADFGATVAGHSGR